MRFFIYFSIILFLICIILIVFNNAIHSENKKLELRVLNLSSEYNDIEEKLENAEERYKYAYEENMQYMEKLDDARKKLNKCKEIIKELIKNNKTSVVDDKFLDFI